MQLPETDALHAEPFQAPVRLRYQIFGASILAPLAGAAASQARIRRDQYSRLPVQCFPNQLFGNVGTVRVGRIHEIDAQLRKPAQCLQDAQAISGWSSNTQACDAHCTVAEPVDFMVPDLEFHGDGGWSRGHIALLDVRQFTAQ